MTEKPELTYETPDVDRWKPDDNLLGVKLLHLGNRKTYIVVGFAWMGATDHWGFLHQEVRPDGQRGVMLCRPMSHIGGERSNGERRYHVLNHRRG